MGGKTVLVVVAALMVLTLRVQAATEDDAAAAMTAIINNDASLALQLINSNTALASWSNIDNQTLLVAASLQGMPSVVQRLVDLGASLETLSSPFHDTPLLLAIESCCIDCINILVSAGSNINFQNMYGFSSLIYAVAYCESQEPFLLNAGASINLHDVFGNTALIIGAIIGSDFSINTLMAAGANINTQESLERTAVMAVSTDGSSALSALLTYCPDLTLTDSDGMTALELMLQQGFTVNAALIQAKLDNMCSFGSTNYSLGAIRSENCIEMVCLTNCNWNNTGIADPTCTTPSDHHTHPSHPSHLKPKPHHTPAKNHDSDEDR